MKQDSSLKINSVMTRGSEWVARKISHSKMGEPILLICHRYRFAYVVIQKCAFTSMSHWILRLDGDTRLEKLTGDDMFMYVHSNVPSKTVRLRDFLKSERYRGYKVITVVRNPYDRIFSAYKYCIDGPIEKSKKGEAAHPGFTRVIDEFYGRNTEDASFESFIRKLSTEFGTRNYNVHWAPQKVLSGVDLFKVDTVLHLERLETELPSLFETLGIPVEMRTVECLNTTRGPGDRSIYTRETMKIIESKYSEDFETFGYDRETSGL